MVLVLDDSRAVTVGVVEPAALEGRAVVGLFFFEPSPPWVIGTTIFYRIPLTNVSLAMDTLWFRLTDQTINKVLAQGISPTPIFPLTSVTFNGEVVIEGPAGDHAWLIEAGHEE